MTWFATSWCQAIVRAYDEHAARAKENGAMDVTRKSARKWIDSLSLRVQQGLFAAATYLILLAICLLAISPEQYDLSVGDVAPKTITASKDIVDEITTERRRQAAADAVSPVYYKDDTVSDTVLSDMDAVFSELRAVRELGEQNSHLGAKKAARLRIRITRRPPVWLRGCR